MPIINNKIALGLLISFIANSAAFAAEAAKTTTTTTTATTPAVMTPVTSKAASMHDSEIIQWAEDVALAAFTFNYQDYQKRLDKLSENFTARGWKNYTKALEESQNLVAVQQRSMDVTAKVTGSSKILEQRGNQDVHAWRIEIPIQVTYKNPHAETQQNLIVELAITTGEKVANANGLGVLQFIARPAEK